MAGLAAASAMPRAAEMPTRRPVKLPGPVVTAMRSSAENGMSACCMTRAISGISASAWPRTIGSDSLATVPCSVSSTAAAQASSAVSIASTRMARTIAVLITVMAGLVPAIHALGMARAMQRRGSPGDKPGA